MTTLCLQDIIIVICDCAGEGDIWPLRFMFIWYLQIFGSLCEGMTNLQPEMFLHGVSIQLLKGTLAAFLQRKVLWKRDCNSTASLLLLNIAGWDWAHHKVIRARRWNVFYRKPSWQNVSVSTRQGPRPPRNLPSPLPVSLTRQWSPAAPLSPDKTGVQFCAVTIHRCWKIAYNIFSVWPKISRVIESSTVKMW